jgi:alginate O-acetyltransferase complex protein AlgI
LWGEVCDKCARKIFTQRQQWLEVALCFFAPLREFLPFRLTSRRMLFNSLSFALFLPVVFLLHWLAGDRVRRQNVVLLAASYFFYGCWDPRFLLLLLFSTALDFYTGSRIAAAQTPTARKNWLWLSIVINLGFLAVFKYYDFFTQSLLDALAPLGYRPAVWTLNIILPVGISFYTFHGLSYVIDIYHKRVEPEGNFVDYALFVSFFPLLVAGPIERATHLLPQLKTARRFNGHGAADGLRQILWGLFKKMVIADNCARYADQVFDNPGWHDGGNHGLGVLFFAIQIYCDFSGYSDIAIGTARLFGIDLLRNFAYPYFSRDIAEFWRRWHISLSSWFRDYVYIPLGGSRGSTAMRLRNTAIIFLLSGLWHGANWTFVAWGALHAVFFMPLLLRGKNRVHHETVAMDRALPTGREALQMASTFLLVLIAWVFFRSPTMYYALDFLRKMVANPHFGWHKFYQGAYVMLSMSVLFFGVEWIGRRHPYAIAGLGMRCPAAVRWTVYALLIFLIGMFMNTGASPFLYFQF